MRHISKGLAVFLVINLACAILSLMVMSASCADPPAPTVKPDIPMPSVPQFTLSYADHSYDVPPKTTSSTDPYTGKVTTNTIPGYHVKNYTIDVTIRNQPYPPTINNGNVSTLKYFIQAKGHYEPEDSFLTSGDGQIDGATTVASNSEYTVVSIPLGTISEGAVDFRVLASLGYNYRYYFGMMPMMGWASANSDWSSIQTFTLPGTPPSSSPTTQPIQPTVPPQNQPTISSPIQPTVTPTLSTLNSENNLALDTTSILIAVVVVLVAIIGILGVALYRKT